MKIAIAGGSGEVAREIIDVLQATKKHEIILLSRKDVLFDTDTVEPDLKWMKVDYANKFQLIEALRGVDTVLSFITPQTDIGNTAQKTLIDACVEAGVRRFAPSEWATSGLEHMPWYAGKGEIREFLKAINKDAEVLQSTLFQPGLFTNYFTHPHKSCTHVNTFQTQIDFQNRRAIILEGSQDARITLTTVKDLANIVAFAVGYEGKWPVVGGIKGCELTIGELIALGERVRGSPFTIETITPKDAKSGLIKTSWLPHVDHPAIPPEQADALASMFLAGMTLAIAGEALNVSDEWNRIFEGYEFTRAEEFLRDAWEGKS